MAYRRPVRIALLVLLGAAFLAVPWALVRYLGLPIPPGVVQHPSLLLGKLPPADYLYLLKAAPYLIWLYLALGFLIEVARTVFGLLPRQVAFLGLSQEVAAKLLILASRDHADPAAVSREALLRGAVPAPLNHTLSEREAVFAILQQGKRIPNELLRFKALPDKAIPPGYQRSPERLWWVDTAVRHFARANPSERCSITQIKPAGDNLLLWWSGEALPPAPFDLMPNLDNCASLGLTSSVACEIAPAGKYDTHQLDTLVPLGLDSGRSLVIAPSLTPQIVSRFALDEIAQWLALVPWLSHLWIVTVGSWAKNAIAPAHQHCEDQEDLLLHFPRTTRHIIALSDTPIMPTGPLQGIQWIGPTLSDEWTIIDGNRYGIEVTHHERFTR